MVEGHIPVSTVFKNPVLCGCPRAATGPMASFVFGPSPKTVEPDSEYSDPLPKLERSWLILSLALA